MNTRQLSYTVAKVLAISTVCAIASGCASDGVYYTSSYGSTPAYVTTSTTTVQTSGVSGCAYQNYGYYSYVNDCPSSYYVRTCYPGQFACWNNGTMN